MGDTPEDVERLSADREFASLLVRLDTVRRGVEQRARLGSADMRLLWLLSDRRPRTLREIAETLGLEQSTVNRQVNAALREQIVERQRVAGQQAHRISPTATGLELFESELAQFLEPYGAALECLGEGRREFLDQFRALVDAYSHAVRRRTWSDLGPA